MYGIPSLHLSVYTIHIFIVPLQMCRNQFVDIPQASVAMVMNSKEWQAKYQHQRNNDIRAVVNPWLIERKPQPNKKEIPKNSFRVFTSP